VTSRELLAIQLDGWIDARGRLRDNYGVRIAVPVRVTGDRIVADDVPIVWIGDGVPDVLADELAATIEGALPSVDVELPVTTEPAPPPVIETCRSLLGDVKISAGPSYVIDPGVQLASTVEIVSAGDRLRDANPGNWDPVEWTELLDGRLGPWAIAIVDGRAVSICHTPVPLTARAAECGVWTDPAFRGRGYAAATAAAWVPLVRAPDRQLFYATDADNRSSQRVAARLGARPIGWTWQIKRPRRSTPDVHPLCSLASKPRGNGDGSVDR
jgi:hypothetical protein